MQLVFAPKAFNAACDAWRSVILLNLVQSVIFILDTLASHSSHAIDAKFNSLKLKLGPLRQVQRIMSEKFRSGSSYGNEAAPAIRPDRASEVRARSGWKALLGVRSPPPQAATSARVPGMGDELVRAQNVIFGCQDDIIELWEDQAVQTSLKGMDIALQDQPGL
jgi:hypothetical protein